MSALSSLGLQLDCGTEHESHGVNAYTMIIPTKAFKARNVHTQTTGASKMWPLLIESEKYEKSAHTYDGLSAGRRLVRTLVNRTYGPQSPANKYMTRLWEVRRHHWTIRVDYARDQFSLKLR